MSKYIYYVAPRVAGVSLFAPIAMVQGIYAKYYGLSLTSIAAVILIVRLFDAITDPVIGYYSDQARLRTGTRKPFMALGAAVFTCSGYFLYSPPDQVGVAYFSFWFAIFYLGFTFFEIPHMAWGAEISTSSHERTKIFNFRTMAGYTGVLLFYSTPLLPWWDTTDITPETLRFSSIISAAIIVPMVFLCLKNVPNGNVCGEAKNMENDNGNNRFEGVYSTAKNIFGIPSIWIL